MTCLNLQVTMSWPRVISGDLGSSRVSGRGQHVVPHHTDRPGPSLPCLLCWNNAQSWRPGWSLSSTAPAWTAATRTVVVRWLWTCRQSHCKPGHPDLIMLIHDDSCLSCSMTLEASPAKHGDAVSLCFSMFLSMFFCLSSPWMFEDVWSIRLKVWWQQHVMRTAVFAKKNFQKAKHFASYPAFTRPCLNFGSPSCTLSPHEWLKVKIHLASSGWTGSTTIPNSRSKNCHYPLLKYVKIMPCTMPSEHVWYVWHWGLWSDIYSLYAELITVYRWILEGLDLHTFGFAAQINAWRCLIQLEMTLIIYCTTVIHIIYLHMYNTSNTTHTHYIYIIYVDMIYIDLSEPPSRGSI